MVLMHFRFFSQSFNISIYIFYEAFAKVSWVERILVYITTKNRSSKESMLSEKGNSGRHGVD